MATSKVTPYHPTGNGQVERYNGIIWKAVRLALKSANLPDSQWELALPDALHSITSINSTPHERFFGFERRSSHGTPMLSWLMSPGPLLLHQFVCANKNDPLVDQVGLQEANPPKLMCITWTVANQLSLFETWLLVLASNWISPTLSPHKYYPKVFLKMMLFLI